MSSFDSVPTGMVLGTPAHLLFLGDAKNGPSVVKKPGNPVSVETSGLRSGKEARFSLSKKTRDLPLFGGR